MKNTKNAKLLYLIPTFQNPAGITTSLEKRKAILELAKKYDVIILEDNPYGELRFSGEDVPTIKSLDTDGRVVYCSSFSKILSAGMRIGFVCGPKELVQKIVVVKQVNDVHTPCLTQMIACEFLKRYNIDDYIKKSCEVYGRKCRFMLDCMDKYFPKNGVEWTKPEGGLFILVTCPETIDAVELSKIAIQKYKVAFVPASNFATDMSKTTCSFRLNYSMMPEEKLSRVSKQSAIC